MIGGEWKWAGVIDEVPLLVRIRLYRAIAPPLSSYRDAYGFV